MNSTSSRLKVDRYRPLIGCSGFTLLEILISVAIVVIIASTAIPIYREFQTRNDVDIAQQTFIQAARRAQQLAQSGDSNTSWGVRYQTGAITIYREDTDLTSPTVTYTTRNTGADETLVVASSVTPSGRDEMNFNMLSGSLASSPGVGTLTLTSASGETRSVTVNAKGMLSW